MYNFIDVKIKLKVWLFSWPVSNLSAIIRKKSHRENAIKGYIIKPSKTSALIKNRRKFYEEKRNGFRSGGINDLYCFIYHNCECKKQGQ